MRESERNNKALQFRSIISKDFSPLDIVSIWTTVNPVLDLCSSRVIKKIDVDRNQIMGDTDADLKYCHTIADWARSQGYWAILSPSAALPGARNLNIYLSDSTKYLSLKVGPDREPLNY